MNTKLAEKLNKSGDTLNGHFYNDCTNGERQIGFKNAGKDKKQVYFFGDKNTSTGDRIVGMYNSTDSKSIWRLRNSDNYFVFDQPVVLSQNTHLQFLLKQ